MSGRRGQRERREPPSEAEKVLFTGKPLRVYTEIEFDHFDIKFRKFWSGDRFDRDAFFIAVGALTKGGAIIMPTPEVPTQYDRAQHFLDWYLGICDRNKKHEQLQLSTWENVETKSDPLIPVVEQAALVFSAKIDEGMFECSITGCTYAQLNPETFAAGDRIDEKFYCPAHFRALSPRRALESEAPPSSAEVATPSAKELAANFGSCVLCKEPFVSDEDVDQSAECTNGHRVHDGCFNSESGKCPACEPQMRSPFD